MELGNANQKTGKTSENNSSRQKTKDGLIIDLEAEKKKSASVTDICLKHAKLTSIKMIKN